jgi:anti-sigma B factor antagonist
VADQGTGFLINVNGPGMFVLKGELDLASRPMFEAAIADAVLAGGPVVLDVSGVTFMDSSGLAALLSAVECSLSGCLVLHGVHGPTERLMALTHVGQLPGLHVIPCEQHVDRGLEILESA